MRLRMATAGAGGERARLMTLRVERQHDSVQRVRCK